MKHTVAFTCFCLMVVLLLGAIVFRPRPAIFILNEYEGMDYKGVTCKIVDYTIGGIMTSAIFYGEDFDRYDRFMSELAKEGRIIR